MTPSPEAGIDSLFQSELASVNEDIRRKAALAAFKKLRPTSRVTVGQFLSGLQQHKEMWAAIATLSIVEFAESLLGRKQSAAAESTPSNKKRTRLSEGQKSGLKSATLRVLEGKAGGLSRMEVSAAIVTGNLVPEGIDRAELADKLRQPLQELVVEKKLHTVGEKRLMKYLAGGKKGK